MTTTYLITGSNRGIGLGLVTALASRPKTTIIAAARDTESKSSKALASIPTAPGSKIVVVKIDSLSQTDAKEAIETITKQGIDTIDTVIANSGIATWSEAFDVPISQVQEAFAVNALGPLILFQATWPLLQRAAKPKFVVMSSVVGSIGGMEQFPMRSLAYGTSKAAVNYITRKIHFENPSLITFPMNPGWVKTDMGNGGATAHGMTEAPDSLEDSINGILSKIDNATRETDGGKFWTHDGQNSVW